MRQKLAFKFTQLAVAAVAAWGLATGSASGQVELIQNGDFETATLSTGVSAATTNTTEIESFPGSGVSGVFRFTTSDANGGTSFADIGDAGVSHWGQIGGQPTSSSPNDEFDRILYMVDNANNLNEGSENNLLRLDADESPGFGANILTQGPFSLNAGDELNFSIDAFVENAGNVPGNRLFADLVLENGSFLDTIELLGPLGGQVDLDGDVEQLSSGSVTVATTGTYTLHLFASGTTRGNPIHVWIDNVSLTRVPEPGSLAMFGLAGLSFAARRRR